MPKGLFEKEISSPYNKAISEKVKELFPEIVKPVSFTNQIPLEKGIKPTLNAGIAEPYKKFADENGNIQRGIVAAERMFEVLDIKPDIQDHPDATELTGFFDSIEFDKVWFKGD